MASDYFMTNIKRVTFFSLRHSVYSSLYRW